MYEVKCMKGQNDKEVAHWNGLSSKAKILKIIIITAGGEGLQNRQEFFFIYRFCKCNNIKQFQISIDVKYNTGSFYASRISVFETQGCKISDKVVYNSDRYKKKDQVTQTFLQSSGRNIIFSVTRLILLATFPKTGVIQKKQQVHLECWQMLQMPLLQASGCKINLTSLSFMLRCNPREVFLVTRLLLLSTFTKVG